MDQVQLEAILAGLPLGEVRYYDTLGSSNDVAARWVAQGAPDLALVVADEQTSGRGRAGRHWYTLHGAAIAFSIVIYPKLEERSSVSRMTALGALAVCETLKNNYHLSAKIKWPNDVLAGPKKVAGVLAEAQWIGERLSSIILGIGINVAPAAVDDALAHEAALVFPSTSVESESGRPVDRAILLHEVLAALLSWRSRLSSPDFLKAWETNLAYREEWVQLIPAGKIDDHSTETEEMRAPYPEGQIIGLSDDGSLKLQTRTGEIVNIQYGEVRLRPVNITHS